MRERSKVAKCKKEEVSPRPITYRLSPFLYFTRQRLVRQFYLHTFAFSAREANAAFFAGEHKFGRKTLSRKFMQLIYGCTISYSICVLKTGLNLFLIGKEIHTIAIDWFVCEKCRFPYLTKCSHKQIQYYALSEFYWMALKVKLHLILKNLSSNFIHGAMGSYKDELPSERSN